jgi:hypothetical protein
MGGEKAFNVNYFLLLAIKESGKAQGAERNTRKENSQRKVFSDTTLLALRPRQELS